MSRPPLTTPIVVTRSSIDVDNQFLKVILDETSEMSTLSNIEEFFCVVTKNQRGGTDFQVVNEGQRKLVIYFTDADKKGPPDALYLNTPVPSKYIGKLSHFFSHC